jgi:hypothetical protein
LNSMLVNFRANAPMPLPQRRISSPICTIPDSWSIEEFGLEPPLTQLYHGMIYRQAV